MTPRMDAGPGRASRRRLLAWSAVPVVLVLCLAAKLLSLGLLAGRAAGAFEASDATSVRTAAEGLQPANIIEPHKALFAAGDADVLAGDFGAARHRFEEALGLLPQARSGSTEDCIIRVNLVLAIEHLGDQKAASDDPASAAGLFREALAAVASAPEGCFSAGHPGGTGDKLARAEARLQEKLAEGTQEPAQEGGQDENPQEPGPDPGLQDKLEQLEDSARQAQRERNEGREREEYLEDTKYNSPARPW
ncbi:MAG: hypothetical protein ACLGIS_05260 [Actinomycetes bacterium]